MESASLLSRESTTRSCAKPQYGHFMIASTITALSGALHGSLRAASVVDEIEDHGVKTAVLKLRKRFEAQHAAHAGSVRASHIRFACRPAAIWQLVQIRSDVIADAV